MLGEYVPAVGAVLDTSSTPIKILVLAAIVAAILATRLGPRGR
jgi:hypothetical protein